MNIFRWLWFGFAGFLILDAPFAIVGAVPDLRANSSHILPFALSSVTRILLIWLFLYLWRQLRPIHKFELTPANQEE